MNRRREPAVGAFAVNPGAVKKALSGKAGEVMAELMKECKRNT
jgi:hypothetical protein